MTSDTGANTDLGRVMTSGANTNLGQIPGNNALMIDPVDTGNISRQLVERHSRTPHQKLGHTGKNSQPQRKNSQSERKNSHSDKKTAQVERKSSQKTSDAQDRSHVKNQQEKMNLCTKSHNLKKTSRKVHQNSQEMIQNNRKHLGKMRMAVHSVTRESKQRNTEWAREAPQPSLHAQDKIQLNTSSASIANTSFLFSSGSKCLTDGQNVLTGPSSQSIPGMEPMGRNLQLSRPMGRSSNLDGRSVDISEPKGRSSKNSIKKGRSFKGSGTMGRSLPDLSTSSLSNKDLGKRPIASWHGELSTLSPASSTISMLEKPSQDFHAGPIYPAGQLGRALAYNSKAPLFETRWSQQRFTPDHF